MHLMVLGAPRRELRHLYRIAGDVLMHLMVLGAP